MSLFTGLRWRPANQPLYSLARLNALFDGIYAIVVTLLVLELHVPEGAGHGDLSEGLAELSREVAVYCLAFLQVMTGWLVSRRISAWSRGIDHWATLLLIAGLATFILLPFLTSTVVASMHNQEDLAVAVRLWAVVLFISFLFLAAFVFYALRRGLFHDDVDPATLRLAVVTGSTVWIFPLLAFGLSYVVPWLGLATFGAVFLLGLLPYDGHGRDADGS